MLLLLPLHTADAPHVRGLSTDAIVDAGAPASRKKKRRGLASQSAGPDQECGEEDARWSCCEKRFSSGLGSHGYGSAGLCTTEACGRGGISVDRVGRF